MADIKHFAYRTIEGREYVLVDYVKQHIDGASDDALEAAARFTEKWGSGTEWTELASAIRSLKKDPNHVYPLGDDRNSTCDVIHLS